MSFYLVFLEPDAQGNLVDVPISDYGPYEKGSEAASEAKKLTSIYGRKVQPRRIAQAGDWRPRWVEKMAKGQLTPLPKKWDLAPIKDHFAHLDDRDPTKIAFIENDELGAIDRVTAVTPGRYLTRFYPEVTDDHRRKLIAAIDPSGEIMFATTPEEIVEVYMHGPESCMDGGHSYFKEFPCWPTAPYGAGDLAVAYTKNHRDRIQSRAVVWPEKKLYGRLYGDVQRLESSLQAEGYTSLSDQTENRGLFVGARILKVSRFDEIQKEYSYVLPYFDNIAYVVDKGDHFVTVSHIPDGDKTIMYCSSGGTGGCSRLQRYCPAVQGYYDARSFAFVNGADEEWSDYGRLSYAFTCDATGQVWSDKFKIRMHGGEVWSKPYFDEHGAVCDYSGKNVRKKELIELPDGRKVHRDYKNAASKTPQEIASERKMQRREAFLDDIVLSPKGNRWEVVTPSRPYPTESIRELLSNRVTLQMMNDVIEDVAF